MAERRVDIPPSEGLLGLKEIEPSPVEETLVGASLDSYFPPSPSPPHSRTSTLGLGNHGPAYYRKKPKHTSVEARNSEHPTDNRHLVQRIQKYSSYTFTVFAAFHITNTSLIPFVTRSAIASDKYLLLTRPYYQTVPFEPLLIVVPLAAHVTSGIALRFYRRRQQLQRYGAESKSDRRHISWPPLSAISALGYTLVPLILGHVFAVRVLPMYLHGDNSIINLSYVAHGFALHPLVSFVGFSGLISVASWHFVWGWAKWLGLTPAQVGQGGPEGSLRKKRRWYSIHGVGAAVAGLWMAGGLGVVGRGGKTGGWIGREYDDLYRYLFKLGR